MLPNINYFNSIFAVVAHTKAAVSQTLCPPAQSNDAAHTLDGHKLLSVTAKPASSPLASRSVRLVSGIAIDTARLH